MINSVAWFHWASSGNFDSRELSDTGLGDLGWVNGMLAMFTCHIPDVPDWWPSSIVMTFFTMVR